MRRRADCCAVTAACVVAGLVAAGFATRCSAESPASAVVSTYVGSGRLGVDGDGADRRLATIVAPVAVAMAGPRRVLYLDLGRELGGRLRSVDLDTGIVDTVAGGGTREGDDVPAHEAKLGSRPLGLAVNSRGDIFIGYEGVGRVDRIDAESGRIGRFAGGGTSLQDGIAARDLALVQPWSVRVDAADNVYIADGKLHAVFRVDPSGSRVERIAGVPHKSGHSGDGGAPTDAQLNAPTDVAWDRAGHLYIADRDNHVIRVIDASAGRIDTFAGTPGVPGSAGDGGDRRSAAFRFPQALLVDGDALLVADRLNHRIRRIDLANGQVRTLAGSGRAGHAGENRAPHEAGLFEPMFMLRTPSGELLVPAARARRVYVIGDPVTLPVPWWRSGWAIAGYGLGLGLLAFAVIRARTRALRLRTATLEGAVARRTRELEAEQQRIERQSVELSALIEAKDRLLARISHEFRTPLAVILGPTRRLTGEQGTTGAAAQALGTIEHGASRLLRLVEQLLSVARLSHGYRGATVAVPAAAVAKRMAGAYESRAAERGLVLTTGGLEDVLVQSSVEVLEAIIGQLLLHAIRLADGAGTVRVSVTHDEHLGQVIVEADGPGFAAGRLAEAFESQRSGDWPSDAAGGDSGDVELPFVAQLVASHGGTIEVASTSATGSRFVVNLPVAFAGVGAMEPGVHGAAVVTPATDRPDDARTATILVIEDHPDMRAYLRELLQTRYRCVTAPDGERGLAQAREDVPDLVVCDVMLPGQDGFAVCHGLKTDERTSHIPVLLLTALEGEQHRLKGLEQGADDYLAKPFEDAELLGRVAGLIELRALLRQRYARDLRVDLEDAADVGARDRAFLARLRREVEHRHADPGLEVARLAGRLAMSERQLQRKVRALLGVTPAEYLRSVRLQHAQERLLAGERPSDVAIAVGFSSHAYFATCFKAEYGYAPSESRRRTGPLTPESPATA